MRRLFVIILTSLCFSAGAQSISGLYSDHFGQSLVLNPDSTFEFRWALDMERSWTRGRWTFNNKILSLTPLLVYDTLRTRDKLGTMRDSMVLSMDQKSEVISTLYPGYLTTGGQNRIPPPSELAMLRGRLYHVSKSGQIYRGKRAEFWTRKKYKTYFKKIKP